MADETSMTIEEAQEAWSRAVRDRDEAERIASERRKDVITARERLEQAKRKAAEAIPVDRTQRTLTDGSPVTADHRELKPNGQQKGYVVLSEVERAKGFVRPVRRSYRHLVCGSVTTMAQSLAETYARDPFFYSGTFCVGCGSHFPVGADGQFVWDGTDEKVGT